MSRKPTPIPPVPDETARVARAAFPTGNPSLTLRDQLRLIFHADDFVDLSPERPARPVAVALGLDHHHAIS